MPAKAVLSFRPDAEGLDVPDAVRSRHPVR